MFKLLLPAFIAATTCLAFDNSTEYRLTGPLVEAGVRLDDEVALIRLLQGASENLGMAIRAAYALGKLPPSANSTTELNLVVAASKEEVFVNYAIRSLLRLGDRKWVEVALERFPDTKDHVQQLDLAASLAEAGRYEGWSVTERGIVHEREGIQEAALLRVEAFSGMKDANGQPVDLVKVLEKLRPLAPEARRNAISQKIRRITAERQKRVQ